MPREQYARQQFAVQSHIDGELSLAEIDWESVTGLDLLKPGMAEAWALRKRTKGGAA